MNKITQKAEEFIKKHKGHNCSEQYIAGVKDLMTYLQAQEEESEGEVCCTNCCDGKDCKEMHVICGNVVKCPCPCHFKEEKEECCSKCKGYSTIGREQICTNSNCPCHTAKK